ncbi:hypothetical protein KM043_015862 [Ampulex compressa]|nr:hypothetical protein KM043_015862 [Ampulex compressa]
MLALLLCFVSFTRSTIAYLSSKVFRRVECRPALSPAKTDDDMDSPITPGSQHETEVGDDDVIDDNVLPPVTPSDNTKRRTNSVIDSAGLTDAFISSGHYIPRQTKSDSTVEGSLDHGYSNALDSSRFRRTGTTSKRADATDAYVHKAVADDDTRGRVATPVTASMSVEKDAVIYNMNHKNRGKCIVFNHEIFHTGFPNRDGSTADARRIEDTFRNLGFMVEILNNLTHNDIIVKITELSEEDHTENDCICIFILTHGLSNDLIWAKDVAYKYDHIWKPFTADKCKTLAGKPKLFFFHACRGDQLDGGTILRRSTEKTETDSVASYKIPTHADFLIAHSTVQGFVSWRDTKEGTCRTPGSSLSLPVRVRLVVVKSIRVLREEPIFFRSLNVSPSALGQPRNRTPFIPLNCYFRVSIGKARGKPWAREQHGGFCVRGVFQVRGHDNQKSRSERINNAGREDLTGSPELYMVT